MNQYLNVHGVQDPLRCMLLSLLNLVKRASLKYEAHDMDNCYLVAE
jgi:hypothetical protein